MAVEAHIDIVKIVSEGLFRTTGVADPPVGDVQEGVTYEGGLYTGTLVVPVESDVRDGVGYGAGGTEFTGDFEPTATIQVGMGDAGIQLHEFGEAITYLPNGGDPRSILAIIQRKEPTEPDELARGIAPLITIVVDNDSTTGISSSEVDTGLDKVTIPVRRGDDGQQRRITKILFHDADMIKFEVN